MPRDPNHPKAAGKRARGTHTMQMLEEDEAADAEGGGCAGGARAGISFQVGGKKGAKRQRQPEGAPALAPAPARRPAPAAMLSSPPLPLAPTPRLPASAATPLHNM